MMYEDNDTFNKGQQNKKQVNDEKSNNKDAMTAKLLASVAAGMVLGSGATYAAQHMNVATEDTPTEEENAETANSEGQQTPEDSNTEAQPTIEERIERLEEQERIREQREQERQRHEAERQRHEEQRQKNEEDRQQKHDEEEEDDIEPQISKAPENPEKEEITMEKKTINLATINNVAAYHNRIK